MVATGLIALAGLAATVPGTTAAFTSVVRNSSNSLTTADFATTTCAGAYRASSPVAWYRLDETSGTTAVDAVAGRNATYRGAPTLGVPRACVRDTGTAVTLGGSAEYVSTTTTLTLALSFSTEVWFRTTSTRGGLLVGVGSSPTGASTTVDRVTYLTDTGQVAFGVAPLGKTAVVSPGTYRDARWHHVVATASLSGLRLYVDGALVGSSSLALSTSLTGSLRIGYDALTGWPSNPTSGFFAGGLDEVAVYNRALTAAEALSHYRAGIP